MGPAIVGNFGSDERLDYTILGHAVNLASRICKTADPNQILIGPEVFERIQGTGLFAVEMAGSRELKGIKDKMLLYEVKGFR